MDGLAQYYKDNFKEIISPEDIKACQKKANALIEKMFSKGHLPKEITLINKSTSHEDARQEAVQEQEQVKEQQQEQAREAESACHRIDKSQPACKFLDPQRSPFEELPDTLYLSKNYRSVTAIESDKATLYPVPFILRTKQRWIAISEADQKFYDEHSLNLGATVKREDITLINMLELQAQVSHLTDIIAELNALTKTNDMTAKKAGEKIRKLKPAIIKNIALLETFSNLDIKLFIHTLMFSGHYTELANYLNTCELIDFRNHALGQKLSVEEQELLSTLKIKMQKISKTLSEIQFNKDNRALFALQKTLHPQLKAQIETFDRTNLSGLVKLADLINNRKIKISSQKIAANKIIRFMKKQRAIDSSKLLPKPRPVKTQSLIKSIKETQHQKIGQFILSLLIFSVTFAAVTLQNAFLLKLGIAAATFKMMQHTFSKNILQEKSNASPSLAPYAFMNLFGFTKHPTAGHSTQLTGKLFKASQFMEILLINLMPYCLILGLYFSELSLIILAPMMAQFFFGGLKSILSTQYFKQFSEAVHGKKHSSLKKLYQHLKLDDIQTRKQRQIEIMRPHVKNNRVLSLPNLTQTTKKMQRLQIALAVLEYCHDEHIILSDIPQSYFSELLLTANALGETAHQGIQSLLKQHKVKVKSSNPAPESKASLIDTIASYSPLQRAMIDKAKYDLKETTMLGSHEIVKQFSQKKYILTAKNHKWYQIVEEASTQQIRAWAEVIDQKLKPKTLGSESHSRLSAYQKDRKTYLLNELFERNLNLTLDKKLWPNYACALVIKKHYGESFKDAKPPETESKPVLKLFAHIDERNRLILSHEKSEKTLYSYEARTHLFIQGMLKHALDDPETLSSETLDYFKALLEDGTKPRERLQQELEKDTKELNLESIRALIPTKSGCKKEDRDDLIRLQKLLDQVSHVLTLYNDSPSSIKSINLEKFSPKNHDQPCVLLV